MTGKKDSVDIVRTYRVLVQFGFDVEVWRTDSRAIAKHLLDHQCKWVFDLLHDDVKIVEGTVDREVLTCQHLVDRELALYVVEWRTDDGPVKYNHVYADNSVQATYAWGCLPEVREEGGEVLDVFRREAR